MSYSNLRKFLGTRIIYDRSFLLKCRASPLSNTPPINLPDIPGVTSPEKLKINRKIVEEAVAGKENGGEWIVYTIYVIS